MRLIVALCALSVACNGVGRAVVGNIPDLEGEDLACTRMECREVLFAPIAPLPDSAIDPALSGCTPPDPALCEPASEPAPDLAGRERRACRRAVSLDGEVDLAPLAVLSCAKLKLSRTQSGDAVLALPDVRWSQVELEVESRDALRLELAGAQLTRVRLTLRGPVEVRVRQGGAMQGVAVTSEAADAAFSVDASEAETLRIGGDAGAFAGRVYLVRSTLEAVELRARELRLETVGLRDALLEAGGLDLIDVTARDVRVAGDRLAISASRLTEFELERCGELSVYRARFAGFSIPACAGERTRLFESSFERGSLAGIIAADMSEFQRSLFGVSEPTVATFWDANLDNINFCAGTERVVVAGETKALCAVCREVDGSQPPIDACAHEHAKPLVIKCCDALSELSQCEPTPERMRPPFK
ncbi:MAG TPA: hypothetical protein VJR89_28420 [Polyangiales bacterium]|nr:hypothetical protein [Polyangiales bacterium]